MLTLALPFLGRERLGQNHSHLTHQQEATVARASLGREVYVQGPTPTVAFRA